MKNAILKVVALTVTFLFFSASSGIAQENFKLDSITTDNLDIEFSDELSQKGIFDWLRPKPMGAKEWTIMVFVNGKNNLEIAGLLNVNQMEAVGSDENMNIVVEIGRMKGQEGDVDLDGNWIGSRRLYIKKDKDEEKITSPIIMKTKSVDMGDYKRIADFVKWSKANYPAKKYMLVIWNHGTGWFDPKQEKEGADKGISFDDETGNYVRTVEIGKIFKEAGKVDILAFDACLMQMAEVAYEAKDYADIIVGAEETVPGYGYPYHVFLSALKDAPAMSAEDFSAAIVKSFQTFYTIVKKSAVLSAIRASKLENFANHLATFADSVKKVNDIGAIGIARKEVLRYDIIGAKSDPSKTISFFGDISHFADLISTNITKRGVDADELKAKADELKRFISNDLVIHNATVGNDRLGSPLSDSKGISVYLPPAETRIQQDKLEGIFENKYQDFAFAKASKWHEFVTFLYNVKAERCIDPGEGASMDALADYAACKTDEALGLKN
ncbi:MAG: clostripain-related cysteine peptidase [Elusimicrobia bacterium]|nr:clostripain-related cysteine peptidase [Elusimicrobiota bacterium]